MKKIIALLIAMMMVLSMTTALAASITVNQDSSYQGTEGGAGRAYKYYKVFSVASTGEGFDGTEFEGGYEDDGSAVTEQGDGKVAYTATADVAAKLGTWDSENKEWTKADGNLWFNLAPIANSTLYSVTWDETQDGDDADTVQDAAAWLIEKAAYESGPEDLTFADGKWTSGTIDAGYYIISSDTGDNLVAATTDIEINEKNDYPPIDKTQEDEDLTEPVGTAVNVAIGDVVTYYAKVTIPKTAKLGDTMVVADTPSKGLDYNDDVAVDENTGSATVTFDTPAATGDQAWTATITVTDGSQGKDVIFKYTMTVNEDALIDTDRINTFDLQFGDNYTAIPDTVPYTTYFGGILKFDGETEEPLDGVKFDLKEDGVEFPVKSVDGVYIPDPEGTSCEVVTDSDGLIRIRGLDSDKTYTLTETEALPGYNELKEDVTLTLTEDVGTAFEDMTAQEYDPVENNQGVVLPSTGGIGTTIFYIAGSILVLAAAVLLITKRRMGADE